MGIPPSLCSRTPLSESPSPLNAPTPSPVSRAEFSVSRDPKAFGPGLGKTERPVKPPTARRARAGSPLRVMGLFGKRRAATPSNGERRPRSRFPSPFRKKARSKGVRPISLLTPQPPPTSAPAPAAAAPDDVVVAAPAADLQPAGGQHAPEGRPEGGPAPLLRSLSRDWTGGVLELAVQKSGSDTGEGEQLATTAADPSAAASTEQAAAAAAAADDADAALRVAAPGGALGVVDCRVAAGNGEMSRVLASVWESATQWTVEWTAKAASAAAPAARATAEWAVEQAAAARVAFGEWLRELDRARRRAAEKAFVRSVVNEAVRAGLRPIEEEERERLRVRRAEAARVAREEAEARAARAAEAHARWLVDEAARKVSPRGVCRAGGMRPLGSNWRHASAGVEPEAGMQ